MSIMRFHLQWRSNWERPKIWWVRWLLFFPLEAAVTSIRGGVWNWENGAVGLLFFLVILAVSKLINRIPWKFFRSQWWIERYRTKCDRPLPDFVLLQLSILIVLVCGAAAIGWRFQQFLAHKYTANSSIIFLFLLVSIAFISVAIAYWTILPQVTAIDAARQQAENLFLNALDGILVVDEQGEIVRANPAAAALLQKGDRTLVGHHLQEFFSSLTGMVGEWSGRSEQIFTPQDSSDRVLEVSVSHGWLPRADQECEYTTILRDITERKLAEELRLSEERYALALQGANDGLWDWNLKNNEIYFSTRWKAMLGYLDDEIATTLDEWCDRLHPDDKEQFQIELSRHLDGVTAHFECEHRILHKDGTYRWMLSRGLAVRDNRGQAYRMAGSQTDVTDRHRVEAQLSYDALHDRLTGLSNRILFQERLEHVLQLAKRHSDFSFAVLYIDLDRFKVINDSLGHLAGDRLLIGIAGRLKACIRSSDTLARLGGDEFAILIEDVDNKGDIIHLVERIQQEFKLPFNLGGQEIYADASIGVLIETTNYDRAEDLLRDADTAMYRAKERGRGCYEVFDITMRDRAVAMLHLETDLRKAIINQEFQLHYQPIVALHNNQITGFEALVRWQHPNKGLVPPMEFIGVAEETGLILPLGAWVLQEACAQMRTWHEEFPCHPPLSVSVNVSGKQFAQVDLVDKICQILAETCFDPHYLKLEITESTIVEDLASAKAKLLQLQALGIQVSIDDFGTGYSSLAYLNCFPINILKIDRSFIQDIDINSERLEIIRAIVSLADSLKIDVVAEGVETASQLAQLCSLQPASGQEHFAQGYLFSKPLNRDAAKILIASGRDCYVPSLS
jgi:diguanylate cyclase (GGDEF)-like protein/PAS domain S-box-containing protein